MKKSLLFLLLSFTCLGSLGYRLTDKNNTTTLRSANLTLNIEKIIPTIDIPISLPIDKEDEISEVISSDRIIYQNDFYYESIPDSIREYIYGKSYKEDCTVSYESLKYVRVLYYNFENEIETGELICNAMIAQDLVEIFYELYLHQYPLESIRLVDDFNADDDLSMEANNTSCFNYRTVAGKKTLSKHALGLAIDINPFYNPYVTYRNNTQRVSPVASEIYADRTLDFPHKITHDDLCYQLFISHGFTWGGDWKNSKDYQHFEKDF